MLPFLAPPMMADARHTVAQTDIRSAHSPANPTYTSVNFGAPAATRGIVVIAWLADTMSGPSAPTCQIAGGAAPGARVATWSGSGRAVGAAIFARGLPTGESGNVSVSWGSAPLQGIVVLRVTGYDLSFPVGLLDTTGVASGKIAVPKGGLLLAASGRRGPNTNAVAFSGVVRRGSDVVQARRDWGWSHRLAAAAEHQISFSPYSSAFGDQAWLAASFAPL